MKIRLCFLILLLVLSLCACSFKNNPEAINDSTDVEETDVVSTIVSTAENLEGIDDEDVETISTFYEKLSVFYDSLISKRYSSLKAELRALSDSFENFENRAQIVSEQNNGCFEYYNRVLNNPFYGAIKGWVDDPDQDINIDLNEVQSTWAYILSEYVKPILEIDLPFARNSNAETSNFSDNEIQDLITNLFKDSINDGLDLYNYKYEGYTELITPKSYTIDSRDFQIDIGFVYKDLKHYQFYIMFDSIGNSYSSKPLFDKAYSFCIRNKQEAIVLNSNYLESLYEDTFCVCLYQADFTTSETEIYNGVKEMFSSSGEIAFEINDQYSMTLTQEDKELFKRYFALNETIISLLNAQE